MARVVGPLTGKQASNYGVAICGSNSRRMKVQTCDEDKTTAGTPKCGMTTWTETLSQPALLQLLPRPFPLRANPHSSRLLFAGLQKAGLHLSVVGGA